ncbi:Hypothetical predicted protein [Xyrichtys novacula]|uniref:SMODS-associated and fused to various effectors domain-containing protein n=1 Tax=Xyrichtys novacula TaxID=13765 RepID=A0AAV1GDQ5_XYRNO|nr:Hypothetical predicted protein [Xyrichtys novacula]
MNRTADPRSINPKQMFWESAEQVINTAKFHPKATIVTMPTAGFMTRHGYSKVLLYYDPDQRGQYENLPVQ